VTTEHGASDPGIGIELRTRDHLVVVTLVGGPATEAIVRMLQTVDAHVAADRSLRVLIDETRLRPSLIGKDDIARFVQTWRHCDSIRRTRVAVHVSNPAMFGLNRMFQGLAGVQGGMAVFFDLAAAESFLAAPERQA
jgi:hypothetical protein